MQFSAWLCLPLFVLTYDDDDDVGDNEGRPLRPPSVVDAAVDDAVFIRASPQLALLPRYPIMLQPADTALGTTSRQLVLNPHVLTPGRAYFAKVSAFHKRTLLCYFCSSRVTFLT